MSLAVLLAGAALAAPRGEAPDASLACTAEPPAASTALPACLPEPPLCPPGPPACFPERPWHAEWPPLRLRTVLLLGDSLMVTDFGNALEARLSKHPRVRSARRAKTSSGLARPDFFDWMETARQEVQHHQPDVVVVILGGNDGQGLTDLKGKAVELWGKPQWATVYRQRVEEFLQVLAAPGRRILWLELPVTELESFERKLVLIRKVQREVVSAREDALHFETRPFFTDEQGRPVRWGQARGARQPRRLRMDDGVHFTAAGGLYFASKVYPAVFDLLELELPEPQGPTWSASQP